MKWALKESGFNTCYVACSFVIFSRIDFGTSGRVIFLRIDFGTPGRDNARRGHGTRTRAVPARKTADVACRVPTGSENRSVDRVKY